LTINAAGTGTISIGATSTGAITLSRATTISTGGAAITGASSVNGNLTLGPATSHLISSQTTAPTITQAITGLTAVACTGCTDTRGIITTTGTPSAAGTVTVTFNAAYASAPVVVITPANASAQAANAYISSTGTTTFVITTTVAAPGATPSWNFIAIQ